MSEKSKPKKRRVRHTRAIQRDRVHRPNTVAPDEVTAARLMEVVHPATLNQVTHFYDLGLCARVLNLPVMVAFIVSLIWRQLGAVVETVRTLNREGVLWVDEHQVMQQAVEPRCSTLSAVLFEAVLQEVRPRMAACWQTRTRPLPPALRGAQEHCTTTVALDRGALVASGKTRGVRYRLP